MKYGESAFDILYLLFAVISGCVILRRARNPAEKQMGAATLILGCGDAFHLVPRVLNYFADADFTAALGIGKLITSITMTAFYVILYYIWAGYYHEDKPKGLTYCVWGTAVLRTALCLFPQNNWIGNGTDMAWGILRNVPFVLLGAVICRLFYVKRKDSKPFRFLWIYICLSFLFYIPVAAASGIVPALGMLMLPKTVCYILMILAFLSAAKHEEDTGPQ